MLGFLRDFTERMRNDRKERWKRIGEKVDHIKEINTAKKEGREIPVSPLTEKLREKSQQMKERNAVKREEVKQQRESMRERLKKPRSRVSKIVEYISTAIAIVPAYVLPELNIWPAPFVREMLEGIGFRGAFFTYFLLALAFYILLIPFRIVIVKALEKNSAQ